MSKFLFFTSILGGGSVAVGGYYAYSVWTAENIAKRKEQLETIKKFKEALTEYENKQESKKVHDYLKEKVCSQPEKNPQVVTWCGEIKDSDSVKTLVEGLTKVSDRGQPYDEMLAEIMGRVPLVENKEVNS